MKGLVIRIHVQGSSKLLPIYGDGEAVVCDENGLAVFDLIRGYRHDAAAVLCAFDLLELALLFYPVFSV